MENTTVGAVNGALYFIAAISFLLFFGLIFAMVYFTVRYRKARNPVASELRSSPWLEVLWVVIPTLLALAMFMYGLTGYRFLRNPPQGSLEVTVHSRQWAWSFEYADGRIVPNLVLPADRDVRLTLTSDDVIHGFYVPDYRIQVDTVPGMKTQAWLRAGSPGRSDILCTVYCGTAHSSMMAKLIVLPPAAYADWYAGKKVDLGEAEAPGADSALAIFETSSCLACHSLDGSKGMGPSFKGLYGQEVEVVEGGKKLEVEADEAYLRLAITKPGAQVVEGYGNAMPATSLSKDEVDSIIGWFKEGK